MLALSTIAARSTAATAGCSQRRSPPAPETSAAACRAVAAVTRRLLHPKAPSSARSQMLLISRGTPPERR